jgi:hypothetical protein
VADVELARDIRITQPFNLAKNQYLLMTLCQAGHRLLNRMVLLTDLEAVLRPIGAQRRGDQFVVRHGARSPSAAEGID